MLLKYLYHRLKKDGIHLKYLYHHFSVFSFMLYGNVEGKNGKPAKQ